MGKFVEQVKDYLGKGVSASKVALDKAGTVVQELGELGVLQIELKKLNLQKKKAFQTLGESVYTIFATNKQDQILATDESIAPIVSELKSVVKNIAKHEKAIKEAEKKDKKK